jgi:hypothetical protein
MTWDSTVFKFPGGAPTPTATGNVYDRYTFWSDGTFLHCASFKASYDFTIPPPPGVLMDEEAVQTGAGSPGTPLHGTAADTVNVSSNVWNTVAYSAFNKGVLRTYNANTLSSGNGSGSFYDVGVWDNFSVEFTIQSLPSSGSNWIWLRCASTTTSPLYTGSGLGLKLQPAYSNALVTTCAAGTVTTLYTFSGSNYSTNFTVGTVVKIAVAGTLIKIFFNGTQYGTTWTSSFNQSSGNTIVGIDFAGITISSFKVKNYP